MMMKSIVLAAAAVAATALAAGPAAAQAGRGDSPVIRVTGIGEVRATPDQATGDFAVETLAATAREAAAENAERMERVIAALVRAGVPRERIETRDYSVFPDHEQRPMEGQEPRIRGYRVVNTVSATVYEVSRVGAVIDAALEAGANRVHGVRFGLRDPQRYRQQAIVEATRRARADAEALATALNVSLQGVREATTTDYGPGMPMPMMERAMASDMAGAPTPITPGEQVVRAVVVVAYDIVRQM